MTMENKQDLIRSLEAILFVSGEPVPAARLADALEIELAEAQTLADEWMAAFNARAGGVRAVKLDDAYQLCTDPATAPAVRRALDIRRNAPLSQAAMEVLAIVAYNQPVTRGFVEQVRGVDCSAVMQGLLAKNLVEERGRLEIPGRPLLYGTTPDFLRCFGVSSLTELPTLPTKQEAADTTGDAAMLDDLIENADRLKQLAEEARDIHETEEMWRSQNSLFDEAAETAP